MVIRLLESVSLSEVEAGEEPDLDTLVKNLAITTYVGKRHSSTI